MRVAATGSDGGGRWLATARWSIIEPQALIDAKACARTVVGVDALEFARVAWAWRVEV